MLRACRQWRLARELGAAADSRPPLLDADAGVIAAGASAAAQEERGDIPALLEFIARARSMRRPSLSAKLKRRAPDVALKVNGVLSRHPRVKAKMRTLALNYLKIQDW